MTQYDDFLDDMDDRDDDVDAMPKHPFQYTVDDALEVLPLSNTDDLIPIDVVYGFSDVAPDDLPRVKPIWQTLPASQRVAIMNRLAEVSDADFIVDYATFASLGYMDEDAMVRLASVKAGGTDDSMATMRLLFEMVKTDSSESVRTVAMQQLGEYILTAELDGNRDETKDIEDYAIQLYRDETQSLDLRRRALEAVSNVTRPEIFDMVENAYLHTDVLMRESAVSAMGNTCDERWQDKILFELSSDSPTMCHEAIQAAGQIGIEQAVNKLSELGYSDDNQLQDAAIWSLGEIGGTEAVNALNELLAHAESESDEDLIEHVEDALQLAGALNDDIDFDLDDWDD